MLLFGGGFALLIVFVVWVYCLIDVITTPEGACRNLPKLAWIFVVLLLPDIGSIAWLVAGKPWNRGATPPAGGTRPAPAPRPVAPDDNDEWLQGVRARAQEQRRRAHRTDSPEDPPS